MNKLFILNINTNPIGIVLMMLFLTVSYTMLNFGTYIKETYAQLSNELAQKSEILPYQIDYEDKFRNDRIDKLKNMYNCLLSEKDFSYYEIYSQFLYVLNYGGPDKFRDGYDMGGGYEDVEISTKLGKGLYSPLQCVQLSLNCFPVFNLKIDTGESFLESEYSYSYGDKVPVILGSEYKDFYNIGDTLKGVYLFQELEFYIKGFLQKDSYIKKGDSLIYLDRYIVMPMFNCIDSNKDNEYISFQVKHYANKTSGYLNFAEPTEYDQVNKRIRRLSQSCSLKEYSVWMMPIPVDISFFTVSNQYIAIIIEYGSRIFTFLFCIIFILFLIKNINKQIKIFAAYLISGMKLDQILKCLIMETTAIILLANILSIIVNYRILGSIYYSYMSIILTVLLLGCVCIALFRPRIYQLMLLLLVEENKNDD